LNRKQQTGDKNRFNQYVRIDLIYLHCISNSIMPANTTIKRKSSRITKKKQTPVIRMNAREAKISKFVDDFYRRYGKMMSKLSHE
jgi:hypothetical protein